MIDVVSRDFDNYALVKECYLSMHWI